MKIIIMVHALTGGGAERVAASWANGLTFWGHDIYLLTDLSNKTYETNDNIKLIQRKILYKNSTSFFFKLIRKLFQPTFSFTQLIGLIKKYKPDAIINVLYLDSFPLLLARAFSRYKFPIIMTDHNAYERPKGSKFKWKQWRNKFIDNRFFDVITVLTQRDKDILMKKGIKNVEVLYNPLFLNPIGKIPKKMNIVMAAGRLDGWHVKGFDLLMKAWKEISPKHPDWKLRLVGQGTEHTKEYLINLAKPYADSIEFVPYTPNIQEEYKNASIFVLSSRYEGWGLVMIEAMSQGCAVIACDFKGRQHEAIKDGENGLLCKTECPDDISKKVEILITESNLRERLQNNAVNSLDYYAENVVAKRLEKIIISCVINKSKNY